MLNDKEIYEFNTNGVIAAINHLSTRLNLTFDEALKHVEKYAHEYNEYLTKVWNKNLSNDYDLLQAENRNLKMALASATDVANTCARETGVEEAYNEEGLKDVILRITWRSNERGMKLYQAEAEIKKLRKALIHRDDANSSC